MSKDDIIKNWKDAKKTKNEENPPANPVGDSELPDSALESVAGGEDAAGTYQVGTFGCCPTSDPRLCDPPPPPTGPSLS